MFSPSIYWINDIQPLRLAIMPRPKGGEWLKEEIMAWKANSIDCVVSLLEPQEVRELELKQEPYLCAEVNIKFLSLPIADRGTPTSINEFSLILDQAYDVLMQNKSVAIHCRAGIGRSGLFAACLLHQLNTPFENIFPILSKARNIVVPDTEEQIAWVKKYIFERNQSNQI
ncbi:MAG: dual specificity protein phosphatase family protein [Thiofilum sp.]|uniref:protein-tyrosine phosphatase family protein n=1 Tax=Thiofilum sp. TaxID=2212733 RepID=UPI0025D61D21|nr:dual specificity protein phosphatase family protein [Thiofilum sp.]MBK8453834.1 dual specificity protein phosphatase family protein [Thiofilum sp.]